MYYNMDAQGYESRYWSNPVLQQIRQSFRETVKFFPATTMLEVGCGMGLDLVHFAKTHPKRLIAGIDISPEMVQLSRERLQTYGCSNVTVEVAGAEEIGEVFPGRKFDLIYVFFGALNTVGDLNLAAEKLSESLTDNGIIVLSFVNKWYIGGMLIDMARFRFSRAFSRLKPVWGGYSPTVFLPSHCYTPAQVKRAFHDLKIIRRHGYTIIHPAWFFTQINRKLGRRLSYLLWSIDKVLDKTFLWRFGEYGLMVFKR